MPTNLPLYKPYFLKIPTLSITTPRLTLIPYTTQICQNLLKQDFSDLLLLDLKRGASWPDQDVIETLPKIIGNLAKVDAPTGFESWMVIKNDTKEIIGDAGFKGLNIATANIDLGYGIITEERRKGYAEEAAAGLIEWAFATGQVKAITANCLLANFASIKLLQKLSFTETKKDNEMVYWVLKGWRFIVKH